MGHNNTNKISNLNPPPANKQTDTTMDFLVPLIPEGLCIECLRSLVLKMTFASWCKETESNLDHGPDASHRSPEKCTPEDRRRCVVETAITNKHYADDVKEIEAETYYFLNIRLHRMDSIARWSAGLRANRWCRMSAMGDKDDIERDMRDLDYELEDINTLHQLEMDYMDNDVRFQNEVPTEEEAFDHYEMWNKIDAMYESISTLTERRSL